MKKSYLAAAAILGAAVFAGEAHAVKIDLGKGKSFKMGFRAKIHAEISGKRTPTDKSDFAVAVPFARIYAKGSISKIVKWAWQGDFGTRASGWDAQLELVDAFIMLDFAKEAKVYAGFIKLPFELHSGIQSGWSYVMPTGPVHQHTIVRTGNNGDGNPRGLANNPFTNPAFTQAAGSGSRSPQLGVWGKVAEGMFKYYLYIADGVERDANTDPKTGYGVRVEFAPVMAGYKGHPGYVLKETYLGKQNTLTVGLSYFTQKQGGANDLKVSSFGIDALWEQNIGAVTPNISIGYVQHKFDTNVGDGKNKGLLVQGQILFNQKTILGKPAIGARWAQSDPDYAQKSSVIGVVGQLYVKGVGNRIALSVNRVKDENRTAPTQKDSWTDITLAFWYNF